MAITDGDSLSEGLEKKRKRSSWVVILAVILVAVLIVGAVAWLAIKNPDNGEQPSSEYTTHSPISITGNGEFTNASGVVRGSGTASDPYIIADWEITGIGPVGILIQDTDVHFIVRNCYVNGSSHYYDCIFLWRCVNGTLDGNICSNGSFGIALDESRNITLINNSCSSNAKDGMHLFSSSNIKMSNNSCSNNYNGISLISSSNNTLGNNNCSSNSYNGIAFLASNNNTLSGNNCSMNDNGGITLYYSSSNNTLSDNNCSSNYYWGIGLASSSNNNEISWNQVSNNRGRAVDISSGSNHSRIWYNVIIGNNGATGTYNVSHGQARDDGTNNSWNSTDAYGSHGNYWSDWTTPDAVPPQGIVDHPYIMLGSAGAKDYYPLSYNPRIIGISFIPSWRS